MSYILKQIGDTPNVPYYEFECDTLADIETISTSMLPMGSVANIIEDGASIVLNGDGEWHSAKTGDGILTDVLRWDGNIEDRPFTAFDGTYFFWISEHVPSIDDFKNGVDVTRRESGLDASFNFTYEDILDMTNEIGATQLIVFGAGAVAPEDNLTIGRQTFPKKGIYFPADLENPEDNHTVYVQIPGYNKFFNPNTLKDEAEIGSGDSGGQKTYSVTVSDNYGCENVVYVNGNSFSFNQDSGPTTVDNIPENSCITLITKSDGPSISISGCVNTIDSFFLRNEDEGIYWQLEVYSVSGDELTGTITIEG